MLIGAPLRTVRSLIVEPSRFTSKVPSFIGLTNLTLIPASRRRVIQALFASKYFQNCAEVMDGLLTFRSQKKEMYCRCGSFRRVSTFSTFSDSITLWSEGM